MRTRIRKSAFSYLGPLALSAALAACGGGGGSSATPGTLSVSLTDAPACGYDHVNVTIQKVRVNASASAADSDPGWTDIALVPAQRFDLLTLTNGVLASLGQTPLMPGHYTQMELVLGANSAATPLANSVVPTGGSEVPLTTPSAQQTGLKLNVDLTIMANQIADMVLDFNACKSVVRAGSSGQYLLKPVIAVTPNYISGVSGYVDPMLAGGNALITVQQGGAIVKATVPDSSGRFLLQPVAPGSYDFVLTAPGRATTVITGVPVAASTVTLINGSAAPIVPAGATDGTAAGVVSMAATPIYATVSAAQTLANGDVLDVAETSVDAVSGAYALTLPAMPPNVAPYVAAPSVYGFSPDPSAGSTYSLSGNSSGVTKTATVVIQPNATVTANFSF